MEEPANPKIEIELNEQTAQGIYSNLAVINHSQGEFVLDYLSMMPGTPKARVVSRIILSPVHAKKLLGALAENIRRYEGVFGEIRDMENMPPITSMTPRGEA